MAFQRVRGVALKERRESPPRIPVQFSVVFFLLLFCLVPRFQAYKADAIHAPLTSLNQDRDWTEPEAVQLVLTQDVRGRDIGRVRQSKFYCRSS